MKSHNHTYAITTQETAKPIADIDGFPVRPGLFDINGAMPMQNGVNFTVHTHEGTSCELLLFHRGEEEPYAVLPFPEEYKIGEVYSMIVFNLDIRDLEYAYRVDGPYAPEEGLIFNKENILLDPYARAVAGLREWGQERKGAYHARVVLDAFDWGDMPQSSRELSDLVIYELHVRGFTIDKSSGVKHPGTFEGLREKIPYLKKLGVNAVELMPIFEFDEMVGDREYEGNRLLDYWGYNSVCFFAPNTSYNVREEYNHEGRELKNLIKAFHENGIEVILDVVFNHTAEGNEKGPLFCFKGFDNKVYYMLTPDGNYYNFSGCGNTLNCNHPIVREMILECLRYWTVHYRIDGFRFDLASILGRSETGEPLRMPPLLNSLACDPVLRNVKLIAEAWDAGGMYQVGSFPAQKRWAEWNGKYRDTMRGYLKGDWWEAQNAVFRMAGSGDMYGGFSPDYEGDYAGYNSCINFFTCHDGFTLYDLYSYDKKHNELNGWDNTDGSDDNRSWNCGVEGETDDPEVLALRFQMIRNACAVLFCSRGTPMFFAGDEFGNTQYGNNNSYCQDNKISWLDWNDLEKNRDLFQFFQHMIAFRKEHTVIRKKLPDAVCGMDPLSSYNFRGEKTRELENEMTLSLSFAGYDREKGRDDIVCISLNTFWETVEITLPSLRTGAWYLIVDTAGNEEGTCFFAEGKEKRAAGCYRMKPRSVAIFVAREH